MGLEPISNAAQGCLVQAAGTAPEDADRGFARLALPAGAGPFVAVGLDPTAGRFAPGGMQRGDKPMPSYAIRWDGQGFRPAPEALAWSRTNADFWAHVDRTAAVVLAIDGPCGLHPDGPRWDAQRAAWDPGGAALRGAERSVAAAGIHLFWSSRDTVLHFDGASRWIARSLTLFAESRQRTVPITAIETHPHGAFVKLWRVLGGTGLPPRKTTPAGRRARWRILRSFIEGLSDGPPASHDEIDAACAALVAGLHRLGLTVAYGTPADGGEIWLPDGERLARVSG